MFKVKKKSTAPVSKRKAVSPSKVAAAQSKRAASPSAQRASLAPKKGAAPLLKRRALPVAPEAPAAAKKGAKKPVGVVRKRIVAQTAKDRLQKNPANISFAPLDANDPAIKAAQAAADKKGFEILVLDVREISGLCDKMVLCSARSSTHLVAVSEGVEEAMRKSGQRLLHSDGRRTAEPDWVLLDYGDLMVHVFKAQSRSDYNLESYYGEAPVVAKLEYD
jgi:ribosome-associated protein